MQIVEAGTAPDAKKADGGDIREGRQEAKLLLVGREDSPDNFKLTLTTAATEWAAPRHRHNFDQIRFPLRGEYVYTKDKVLPAGHVAYFPEGGYYGPQVRREGLLMVLCQLGGANGDGFLSRPQRKAALDALRTEGTFAKGIYSHVDAQGRRHNQDSSEAVWEKARGRKIVYPEPRFQEIIAMNPAAFGWIPRPGAPGVAEKWLGTFNERGTEVGFFRLERGATLNVGGLDQGELLFLVSGQVRCQGRTCPPHSAIGLAAGESPLPIQAIEPSELYCIRLPRFVETASRAQPRAMAMGGVR